MESIKMKFKVDRSENNEIVNFFIPDLENISVNITDNNSEDIENLFNLIFQEIIQRQKLIEFELDDSNNDLFNEVANDIVVQINSEIIKKTIRFLVLIKSQCYKE